MKTPEKLTKKTYARPKLVHYGSLRDLTRGGTGRNPEQQPWQNQHQRP